MVHEIGNILEARRFHERLLGLMGRRNWPSSHRGIWFPQCRSVHTFFTFLKPDLLFMDRNLNILEIFPSAGVWRVFVGPKGTTHCLEMPSGYVQSNQLKVGDQIHFKTI